MYTLHWKIFLLGRIALKDNFYDDREIRKLNSRSNDRRKIKEIARDFLEESFYKNYSYDFDWLGLPIIQYPEDIVRLQQLVWSLEPDCIIETGVARGGSLIYSASLLELLNQRDKYNERTIKKTRKVVGIDIDIRAHNRENIEKHFLSDQIRLIQGSSIDINTINQVRNEVNGYEKILVLLDSFHSEAHVLEELRLYSEFVGVNSYIVVYDTVCEILGVSIMPEKGWAVGNNPYTAVYKFLNENDNFIIDEGINNLVSISTCQSGYLRRIK